MTRLCCFVDNYEYGKCVRRVHVCRVGGGGLQYTEAMSGYHVTVIHVVL